MKKNPCLLPGAAILLAAVLAAFAFLRPPVEGCYRSPLFTTLDGSAGYLQLHDGTVDMVNIGGAGGESRETVGKYRLLGHSEIEIVFTGFPQTSERVSIRWTGFAFSTGFAGGMPDGNLCPREFLPWRLHKVQGIKQTVPQ